jgi:adenosine deaminase
VELHRHLEGSLRLSTLIEIARQFELDLPVKHPGKLRPLVQIGKNDSLTAENFLSKFQTLRQFFRSPDIIRRVAREAVADAAADNIQYLELRFTPVALSMVQGFPMAEVMDWVIAGVEQASNESRLVTRLVASVNRHEPVDLAAKVVELAVERMDRCLVALDLAGNEVDFSASPFQPLFAEARAAGLQITMHAGEWCGAENVRQAIEDFNAQRIGHGVRILEDEYVVQLAREREVVFEVCITSNYQSGVVPLLTPHPLRQMMNAGLNVTINTDDPSISHIQLSDEYWLAYKDLGLPLDILRERMLAAIEGAFLPEKKRLQLAEELASQWPTTPS